MSNVLHESFSTNASTTSVTLTTDIAGGGFAIWAFYNGAVIIRGTHYTVKGRVLTFTFTLDANSDIDVIYHRT